MSLIYRYLPAISFAELDAAPEFVLLETNRFSQAEKCSYLFTRPLKVLRTRDYGAIERLFSEVEELAQQYYLAGWFSYELGCGMDGTRHEMHTGSMPLLWLGVFENAVIFDHASGIFSGDSSGLFSDKEEDRSFSVTQTGLAIGQAEYLAAVARIKSCIEAGDTYQTNFTTKHRFRFTGCPYGLYQALKQRQHVAYNSFMKFDGSYVISISPELFFRRTGDVMQTRPMKGTLARGRTLDEDRVQSRFLKDDPKNRSENVMIVDLLRNDLGRVSQVGSVEVPKLFEVEKYDSIFQMTSTVQSKLRAGTTYHDLFKALFPCGSVTGAPKIRTMKIIRQLEQRERGIYTGAIGFMAPSGNAVFNVPIRTITLRNGAGEMGVGSGIVYDSDAEAEFDECILKTRFLIEDWPDFALIETMLWDGEYGRLPRHLDRLAASASYFDFSFDRARVSAKLKNTAAHFGAGEQQRVRLLLQRNGDLSVTNTPVREQITHSPKVTLSAAQTSSRDRFFFHKTTNRALYDREFRYFSERGYYDVLFTNERGEVTEGAISNIFIQKDGKLLTPPIACGLLNGVYRQELLGTDKDVQEGVLLPQDLDKAEAIYLTNSVRGMVRVRLEPAKNSE